MYHPSLSLSPEHLTTDQIYLVLPCLPPKVGRPGVGSLGLPGYTCLGDAPICQLSHLPLVATQGSQSRTQVMPDTHKMVQISSSGKLPFECQKID